MTLVIPMVTWQDAREEWVVDIYSRLLGDRIIFLGTPIDEQIANLVVAELLHLESEQSDRDIAIYVNSPGGSVYAWTRRHALGDEVLVSQLVHDLVAGSGTDFLESRDVDLKGLDGSHRLYAVDLAASG